MTPSCRTQPSPPLSTAGFRTQADIQDRIKTYYAKVRDAESGVSTREYSSSLQGRLWCLRAAEAFLLGWGGNYPPHPVQLRTSRMRVADIPGRSKIDADAAHRFVIGNLPHLQKSKFKGQSPSAEAEASTSAAAVAQRQAEAAVGRPSRFKHVAQETERIVPGEGDEDEDEDEEEDKEDNDEESDEEEEEDGDSGEDVEMADAEALLASVDEQIEDSDKGKGRKRKRRAALE